MSIVPKPPSLFSLQPPSERLTPYIENSGLTLPKVVIQMWNDYFPPDGNDDLNRVKTFVVDHTRNVLSIGINLGREFNLDLNSLGAALILHDIGKLNVPWEITLKEGRFTEEEYEIMKQHPSHGIRILEQNKDMFPADVYRTCYEVILHHHEHWDGKGYPDGLQGSDIPLSAQITAVADAYDGMINQSRAFYRKPQGKKILTNNEAFEELNVFQQKQFNPKIVAAAWELFCQEIPVFKY